MRFDPSMKGSNDNEPTYEHIGLAAERALRKLYEERDERDADKDDGRNSEAEKIEEQRAFIEQRIREIERFERAMRGQRTRRKRMK